MTNINKSILYSLKENSAEDQLDKSYPAIVKALREILELFGIDKNIINDKLDGGEVNQSDFDDRLYGLMAAVGNNTGLDLKAMQDKTSDLIYDYTESFINDLWNDPSINGSEFSGEDKRKMDYAIENYSRGLESYINDKLYEIAEGID